MDYPTGNCRDWYGFKRHEFTVMGHAAWIVEPAAPQADRRWNWCLEWPEAFVERCAAPELLKRGFHHVHVNIFGTWANPAGMRVLEAFYDLLRTLGFPSKASLMGLSMGGLYSYRFAMEHPDRVMSIYGDAPVCDLVRYPLAGRDEVYTQYGLADEAAAKKCPLNPIDHLDRLAAAGIPLLHVVGQADDVVVPADHTDVLERRYRALGGNIRVLRRAQVGHHPHGWDDPTVAADFIESSWNHAGGNF